MRNGEGMENKKGGEKKIKSTREQGGLKMFFVCFESALCSV